MNFVSGSTTKLQTVDNPPHNTVYVSNIFDKLNKQDLHTNLYHAFAQYGHIVEIHSRNAKQFRGQAWLVFDKLDGAIKAVRSMDSFMFFGKPLKVTFAKEKSDVISKADGTFKPRGIAEKTESKLEVTTGSRKRPANSDIERSSKRTESGDSVEMDEDMEDTEEKQAVNNNSSDTSAEPNPPNNILFVENLPEQIVPAMLAMLFQQYEGYQEARLIPGQKGIAFVEFFDEFQAGNAKDTLQGFKITGAHQMKISFAKK